jgi:hypothetical protein
MRRVGRHLLVVVGAGASFDCASFRVRRNGDLRPPLVTELFGERFASILEEYPLAQQVAPAVRRTIGDGSIALEQYLREELRDSPYPHLRRRYRAVPLYLQHLLWEVSFGYTDHPDNYDLLITETLKLDRVTFVTLNYDTILDGRLGVDSRIGEMSDYVRPDRQWALVKLHGSVNWARRIQGGPRVGAPLAIEGADPTYASDFATLGEQFDVETDIVMRDDLAVSNLRTDARWMSAGDLYYPALVAPLGSADEIVCPEAHVEWIREAQRNSPLGLSILVLGYSGLDQQLLELLAWGQRPVTKLCVVNGTSDASYTTVQILAERLRFEPTSEMAFNGGFDDFAQSEALTRFIEDVPESGP